MSKMGETVREWGMLYKAVEKPEFLYESGGSQVPPLRLRKHNYE